MAKATGVWLGSVQRIWRVHNCSRIGCAPSNARAIQLCAKLSDIVGLYVDPPAHAVVLSIDEKSQIQALDRTQPGLPIKPGRCQTMTHDYKRHGTTTLLAGSACSTHGDRPLRARISHSQQGGSAMALVIMCHGLAAPGLIGNPGWVRSSAWIWLFSSIDSTTACAGGSTKPTMSLSLAAKLDRASVEGAQPMRLQFVHPPECAAPKPSQTPVALAIARPVQWVAWCGGSVQVSATTPPWFPPQSRLAGLAGLVAQQTFNPALGKALLPAPHRRPADADGLRHPLRRVANPPRRARCAPARRACAAGCGRP